MALVDSAERIGATPVSEDIVLLPEPQHLARLAGTHTLRPDRFIWLRGEAPAALLRTGQLIQQALATVGPRWELTAGRRG